MESDIKYLSPISERYRRTVYGVDRTVVDPKFIVMKS